MIYLTKIQGETLECLRKHQNTPYRLSLMSKELNITSGAVLIRLKGLIAKKLLSREGKSYIFHDLPYEVVDKSKILNDFRLKRNQRKLKPPKEPKAKDENEVKVKLSEITREIVTYTRHQQKVRIDPPCGDIPPVQMCNGKITRIPLPKYK